MRVIIVQLRRPPAIDAEQALDELTERLRDEMQSGRDCRALPCSALRVGILLAELEGSARLD